MLHVRYGESEVVPPCTHKWSTIVAVSVLFQTLHIRDMRYPPRRHIRPTARHLPNVVPHKTVAARDAILVASSAVRFARAWRLVHNQPWPTSIAAACAAVARSRPKRALIRDETACCAAVHGSCRGLSCLVPELSQPLPMGCQLGLRCGLRARVADVMTRRATEEAAFSHIHSLCLARVALKWHSARKQRVAAQHKEQAEEQRGRDPLAAAHTARNKLTAPSSALDGDHFARVLLTRRSLSGRRTGFVRCCRLPMVFPSPTPVLL